MFPIDALPYLRTVFEAHREYPDTMQRETGAIISHVFHRNGVPFKSFYRRWRSAWERAGVSRSVAVPLTNGASRKVLLLRGTVTAQSGV